MSSLSKVASIKCITLEFHPCPFFLLHNAFHCHCPLPSQLKDGIINVTGNCGHLLSAPRARHNFKRKSPTDLFCFFSIVPILIITGFLIHEHLLAGHLKRNIEYSNYTEHDKLISSIRKDDPVITNLYTFPEKTFFYSLMPS